MDLPEKVCLPTAHQFRGGPCCTVTRSSPRRDAACSSTASPQAGRSPMSLRRWEWPARRPIAGGAGSWLRASPGCRTVPAVHDAALGGHRVRWSGASSVSAGARSSGRSASATDSDSPPRPSYRVLCRLGLQRLSWLDRPTGRVIRRYEHLHPGDLLHMDIKKLGRIPPGGGWRAHGRGRAGARQRVGYAYIHSAVRRPLPPRLQRGTG